MTMPDSVSGVAGHLDVVHGQGLFVKYQALISELSRLFCKGSLSRGEGGGKYGLGIAV